MNNPHTIRINPKKEKDLHEFFQQKGFKEGVKFLFNFYQQNQNLADEIVDRLKNEVDFSKPKTSIKPKKLDTNTSFNFEDDCTNMF